MKRNRRTVVLGHEELTPLTEHILSRMGPAGSDIRKRLVRFYRERLLENPGNTEKKRGRRPVEG
jgi:hypothetical protein